MSKPVSGNSATRFAGSPWPMGPVEDKGGVPGGAIALTRLPAALARKPALRVLRSAKTPTSRKMDSAAEAGIPERQAMSVKSTGGEKMAVAVDFQGFATVWSVSISPAPV
jgi:hypothetical protein